MSYQATNKGGSLIARTRGEAKKAISILSELCDVDAEINKVELGGTTLIDVFSKYTYYDKDDFYPVAELIDEGFINFIGEDNEVWTLVFNDGEIDERQGYIAWDDDAIERSKKTVHLFDHIYTLLYEDKIPESYEMIAAGEKWMSENPKCLDSLVRQRGDLFTSDREINALALALNLEPAS